MTSLSFTVRAKKPHHHWCKSVTLKLSQLCGKEMLFKRRSACLGSISRTSRKKDKFERGVVAHICNFICPYQIGSHYLALTHLYYEALSGLELAKDILLPAPLPSKCCFAFWKRLLSLVRKAGRGCLVLWLTLNATVVILNTVHRMGCPSACWGLPA